MLFMKLKPRENVKFFAEMNARYGKKNFTTLNLWKAITPAIPAIAIADNKLNFPLHGK